MAEPRQRLLERDAEARLMAQTEFERPLVVEAGAGTGKTSILVARIVAWCLGPGWQRAVEELGHDADSERIAMQVLDGVVAITFTEAAAAEMAQRTGQALAAVEQGVLPNGVCEQVLPPAELRRPRALALLAGLNRLHVRTIHSFCQWLLRRFPVEAGLDPAFEVDADELRTEALIQEAVDEAVQQAFSEGDGRDWLTLARNGVGPPEVADTVLALVQVGLPAELLAEDPFDSSARSALADWLDLLLSRFEQAGGDRLNGVGAVRTRETVAALDRLRVGIDSGPLFAMNIVDLAGAVSAPVLERLAQWRRGRFLKKESAALGGAAGAVSSAAAELERALEGVQELRPQELDAARRVVAALLSQVYVRLDATGLITYSGLLSRARELLSRHQGLRGLLRSSIRQLLVDEFQDTDRQQCDIVRLLALDGRREQRPGLFIVGDPKQSIYGWRDADLAAYADFVKRVEEADGIKATLSVNFRSVPAILDQVERVVAPVMVAARGVQPPFEPLVACEKRRAELGYCGGGRAVVEHWVTWPRDADGQLDRKPSRSASTELEAVALARDMLGLHADGVAWGRIGVLLRSTSDLDAYLEALRQSGVPYVVAHDREYFRRREVVEAAALVRWLLDPTDLASLLTVLRSDVVGVPDAALLPLWRRGLAGCLINLPEVNADEAVDEVRAMLAEADDEIEDDLPGLDRLAGWQDGLVAAVGRLHTLRRSVEADPPDLFVERLRTVWLAEATAAARYLGSFRLARLERFFSDLEQELVEGEPHLAATARFLRRAVERELSSREPSVPDETEQAVQVMTIHRAKGLDFDHVYLLQLDKRSGGGGQEHRTLVLSRDGRPEYCLFGWPTPAFLQARAFAERVEQAERVRMLYVAMTRAKDRLVLASRWRDGSQARAAAEAQSLQDLVAHRIVMGEVSAQAEQGVERRTDDSGAQWVLPALGLRKDHADTNDQASTAGLGFAVPAEQIRSDRDRLSELRTAAMARMRRPYSAAVTAESHGQLHHEQRADGLEHDGRASGEGREAAMAVGTAIHELMEHLDLDQPMREQVETLGARVRQRLEDRLAAEEYEIARGRLDEILAVLETGRCLQRLQQLAGHVKARELPVLLPPDDSDTGPVGFFAGSADLVYSDPASGSLVVADYKTDRLTDPVAIETRAATYAGQGRRYAAALQLALDLDEPPRVEFWFLLADEVVEV